MSLCWARPGSISPTANLCTISLSSVTIWMRMVHVHGLQLGELERLREAIRHASTIRREQPGISYGGNANTAPITAVNDTRERALINSFDFTVTGWGIKANLTSGDISQDVSFWNETSVQLGTKTTNDDLSHHHLLAQDREVLLHVETCQRSRATRVKGWSTSTSPSWPSRRGSQEATTGSSTRRTSTSLSITVGTSRSSPTGLRASTLQTRSTSLS